MSDNSLTVQNSELSPAFVGTVQLWASSRTDPTSSRREDLKRDKTNAVLGFFQWCGKAPAQAKTKDIAAWQVILEGRGLAPATIYAMVSRISSFYTWAMKDPDLARKIKKNPVTLARPKAPKPYQSESCKSLDDDQVRALVEVVKGKASFGDVVGLRDLAILLLLTATGMRRQEVLSLKWRDIRVNGGLVITAKVKGGDYRTRAVDAPGVVAALIGYLKASGRLDHMQADDPLWISHDRSHDSGAALSSHAFARNMARYAAKVGIDGFHVHMLRHTSARIVGDESGDLGEVQSFLNHKSRATTRVYLQSIGCQRDRFSGAILNRLGIE